MRVLLERPAGGEGACFKGWRGQAGGFTRVGARLGLELPRGRSRVGFTLIEVLAVVAIIGILTAGLVSGIQQLHSSYRLTRAVDVVAQTVAFARNRALAEEKIFHVRIKNNGYHHQEIGVYHFPRASDGLQATTEEWVWEDGYGWNESSDPEMVDFEVYPPVDNYRVLINQLPEGSFFETEYDPGLLWTKDNVKLSPASPLQRPVPSKTLHGKTWRGTGYDLATLFYTGIWDDAVVAKKEWPVLDPADGNSINLLPKVMPDYYGGTATFPPRHTLLFFYPDGSASDNILILVRNEESLDYLLVWRTGLIQTGQIRQHLKDKPNVDDFRRLGRPNYQGS